MLSSKDLVSFTPEHYRGPGGDFPPDAPVYVLAPMTWRERARFRARLIEEGVDRYPNDKELNRVMRQALLEAAPQNLDELLEVLDRFELFADTPASDQDADERVTTFDAWSELLQLLKEHSKVAKTLSMRSMFNEVAPTLAFMFSIRRWENISAPFRRANGVLSEDCLDDDGLPFRDVQAAGGKALSLAFVSDKQRGNSGSPSQSADGQSPST